MIISDVSVKRPVFASVISLLLIAFGLVAFERLSLREYPDIDPPVVTVEVNYPGAPANVVETRVTEIIEERISGIEGIEFIESSSSDGESNVTIEFSINRDIDAAANDVRDRIAGVQDNLPEEAEPPEVQKVDSSNDIVIWQNLASSELSVPEITDYADRYLVDQYSTLDGVARVRVGGGLSYAMRIWLDRMSLAARNLSVADVEQALRAENIELPAGSIESDQRLFKARISRNFNTPEDFTSLVLAEGDNGYLVRLGDVARVELGLVEDRTLFRGNGVPMVGIGVVKQSTANSIEVARAVKALTAKLNQNLPEGMSIEQSYDASIFIEEAIKEVYFTLFVAIGFVVFVIFMFLGNWRAMLIPAVTVPVSIIATFIVINALGFSINLLTLLALVLAIGLVVDDAIVMLENIVRRMQEKGETPLVAAYRGARQVGFAVVATTLVLVAVFVPITFLQGDIGRLFTEFSLTIAAAVTFSSLVALTLSPMLASKLLKPNNNPGKILKATNSIIKSTRDKYVKLLVKAMRKPITTVILFFVLIAGTAFLYPKINQEFTPKEDRGAFFVSVNGPEGATYEYMEEYMTEIEGRMMKYIDNGELRRLLVRSPRSFGNISSFNSGIIIAIMNPWDERRSAFTVMNEVREGLSDLPGVRAFPIMRQGLGGGTGKPIQFVLGGADYAELAEWRDIIFDKINQNNPGFTGLDSGYKETRPQIDFDVDYDAAADLGVRINEIGRTLQTMLSGRNVTTYIENGEEYDVIMEGEREQQNNFSDIENIYVRSQRSGELIPLSSFISIKEYGAADNLTRYNRVRSITLEANLTDDLALGDALQHLEQLVDDHLPDYAITDYKGQTRDFIESGNSIIFVFALGLLVVFLVLAAQFESYVHPFVIMFTVPLAMGGGLLGLFLMGGSINIYSQIGLIILIGLATKNGILIVEFANQIRDMGYNFNRATLMASKVRFRPIVMTGLTTIAGSIPLLIASGAGAETRVVIGTVILFGVVAATLFTLFIVPVAYSLLARNTSSPETVAKNLAREQQQISS
ncbi:efflux RND transporter permease subunit [Marinicella sp. S1101]|uniref:efflux RND transporter permease subunit n=1 Tax=Marinicella marina TaxID=2996016 RepID=UPI002260B5D5|nr:efflux RND transporter permease subunit [Marinicella marina]MCX7552837.1 efflux RND transporter permease subunit [Marinicella marina]MDJ1139854.1 efflux RND transporter permease subunit [Marinicella marina]